MKQKFRTDKEKDHQKYKHSPVFSRESVQSNKQNRWRSNNEEKTEHIQLDIRHSKGNLHLPSERIMITIVDTFQKGLNFISKQLA
jgi:hypothetical protein